MQSTFILKCIFYVLIINVTFCRSCLSPICKASCYFQLGGFDFGYCSELGNCQCMSPTVYVFYGVEHDLNEYIETTYDNDYLTKIQVSDKYQDEFYNNNIQIWREIVEKITKNYPFITEIDLKNLKAKIIKDNLALSSLTMYLKNSLENALNNIKKLRPETTNECDNLLRLVQQNTYKTRGEKTTVTYTKTKSLPDQKPKIETIKTGIAQNQKKIVQSENGKTINENVKNSEKTKNSREIVYEEVSEEIDEDDDDDDDDDDDNNSGYQQFNEIRTQNVAAKKPITKQNTTK